MNIILDACAVITFLKESGTLLTSDRKEFEPVAVLNICPITLIR